MTEKNDEILNEEEMSETQTEENSTDDKISEEKSEDRKKNLGFKKKEDKDHKKIKELEDEISRLNEQVIALRNEYYKAFADADNTKKRLQQDYTTKSKYMMQNFATEMLSVIDNLERALANADQDSAIYTGVSMVYQQLINALHKEGVEEIEALGLEFNPNYHHAIMAEAKEGVKTNIVIEVLQKGYKLKDRILRASLVKVSE